MRRLVLVGFMGCGKTTVGRLVAQELGWRFVDLDQLIEERLGMAVGQVFSRLGEARFREEERQAAEELAGMDDVVVAAGGGAFAQPGTRQALQKGAVTVWLSCELPTLLGRIPLDGSRPLATDRETIARLLSERERFYRLADCRVDATREPAEAVAREVVAVVSTR